MVNALFVERVSHIIRTESDFGSLTTTYYD
jgi:hypothetical protein